MLRHLLRALVALFPSRGARAEVAGLVLVMASVPVVEMLVMRMFSDLVVEGPAEVAAGRPVLTWHLAFFLGALVLARALHHIVRVARVAVFRRRFTELDQDRNASRQSWDWALALELSGVLVSIVQVAAFSAIFFVVDARIAALNLVLVAAVLWAQSRLYARELGRQHAYLATGAKEDSTPIGDRVGGRIRIAELGASLGSVGMALVLVPVILLTLAGSLRSSDAVVLFLGLRLLYGQLGTFASSIMRFARAAARTRLLESV